MTSKERDQLLMPLIQQYNKTPDLSVSHIFKLRPEELSLFFKKEHLEVPLNQGEKRESLVILEKVGLYDGLLKKIVTDGQTGIIGDEKDIKRRQTFFGNNIKRLPQIRSFFRILLGQFEDFNLKVLLVAATLTFLIGFFSEKSYQWVEGASIYFAVAFIALFTTSCDYLKEKQYLKLFDEIRNQEVSVVRGQYGLSQPSLVSDLVVGDIVLIETGMRIPADCILLDGMDITADESTYNEGRPISVAKSISKGEEQHRENPDPFLLANTLISTGSGRAVVAAVGKHTRFAQEFPTELFPEEDLTPLQERLEQLAGYIGKFGYIAGALIFIAMSFFLICQILFSDAEILDWYTLQTLLRYFSIGVAVVIVAVPEGLPLAVSISMAFSVDVMKKDQLLVKKTYAPETLGYIREICTGKTATLTKNDMTVNTFYTVGKTIENHDHALIHSGLDEKVIDIIRDCIIYNCDSRVEMSIDAKYSPEGNGTEVAMLRFLQSNDFSIQDLLIQKQREGEHECCIPFGPVRKRQVEVIRPYKGCNYVRVVVKGAPEYVIKYCNKVLTSDGEQREIGEEERDQILQENVIPMAKKGLRTLLYAYKDMDSDHWEDLQAQNNNFVNESDRFIIEEDLTFVAAFGLNDDLRDGVKQSIEKLREASINTRMISGDNIHTAIAAAIKAGILLEGEESVPNRCMNGAEFSEAIGGVKLIRDNQGNEKWVVGDKKKFKQIAESLLVLARSTPEDKFALIVGLKDIGSYVAVTADGINDARALQSAHVGFCMGISGCEVAKDAADIIILDDNFNSVFKATKWGRNILDNIRKFIQFQLVVNIVCLIIMFLGGATLGNPPFSVIQLLWINMIMDTLAAISLATEPPHPVSMKLEKQKKTDRIILPVMWRNIIGQVAYQLTVLIVMLYTVPWWFGKGYDLVDNYRITFAAGSVDEINKIEHYTILFHTFVLMNLFNQLNSRKIGWKDLNIFDQFFNNLSFLFVLILEIVVQFGIVQFGGNIFRTQPLSWEQHLTCFCFGLGSIFVAIGMKFIPEVHIQQFNFAFNESGKEDDSAFSRLTARLSGQINKSETERLLDSN